MFGIDLNGFKPVIQEYKNYRYFLIEHEYWTCGYVIIDSGLFASLGLGYYRNFTTSKYGEITWVCNLEFDTPVETQKENEIFFGIGDKRFDEYGHGEIPNKQETESIVKEWIDWIVKELETKQAKGGKKNETARLGR